MKPQRRRGVKTPAAIGVLSLQSRCPQEIVIAGLTRAPLVAAHETHDSDQTRTLTRKEALMSNHLRRRRSMLAAWLVLCVAGPVWAQSSADHPVVQSMGGMKMVEFPGMPKCSPGSVLSGDPAKGPSIIFAKTPSGCMVPWHWHTPNERCKAGNLACRRLRDDACQACASIHLYQLVRVLCAFRWPVRHPLRECPRQ